MKKQLSLILALLIVMSSLMTACGNAGDSGTTPATNAETTAQADSETTTESLYDYPDVNYEGYEFVVLNPDEQFNTYCHLDHENMTGESLDDAVFQRNRKVEDIFNFKFVENEMAMGSWGSGQIAFVDAMINSVLAGDHIYDAGYLPVSFKPSIITEGYVMNLRDIPELQLDAQWWDSVVNEALTVNDKLYTASSPLNLMGFGLTLILLFNETMMDNINMEYPYDLVLDGKWTLDKFNEYVQSGISLNGDSSFTWDPDGTCVYGIAGHTDMPASMFYTCGEPYMTRTSDGFFEFSVENDKFYSIADKLASIFKISDGSVRFNNGSVKGDGGYLDMFRIDRAMFITCELKATLELREMDSTFGLLPAPKYDENQQEYKSYMNYITCFLTIPITQQDTSRAGTILDALSFESSQSVLPEYYNVTVSQKGLRNENSIEMMDIVNNNRGLEFSQVMGITSTLHNSLNSGFTSEKNTAASVIATNKEKILAQMETVFDCFR